MASTPEIEKSVTLPLVEKVDISVQKTYESEASSPKNISKNRVVAFSPKTTNDQIASLEVDIVSQTVTPDSAKQNVFADAAIENKELTIQPTNQDSSQSIVRQKIAANTYQSLNLLNLPAEPEHSKKIAFTAGLSGMIAKVKDMISNSPGVSFGLYAEQRLTDNISIRPGLALAKHTYALQDIPSGDRDMFSDITAPALDGLMSSVESFDTYLDFMAMEIPINFLFKIHERRNKSLFVSAGASTMVYLSQSYSGTLNSVYTREVTNQTTGETYNETNRSIYKVESEYEAFSRMDLFGLANLSAGYSFPFSKHTNMVIEPFVQLPISKITSNNMRMGFGGVSIKIQLNR
jgi:hypothetical protein